jgi:hypothetical protein
MNSTTVYIWSPTLETYPSEIQFMIKLFRKIGFMFPISLFVLLINGFCQFIPKIPAILLFICYSIMMYEYFEIKQINNNFNMKYYLIRQIIIFAISVYIMFFIIVNIKKGEIIFVSIYYILPLIHNICMLYCAFICSIKKINKKNLNEESNLLSDA